MTKKMNKTNKSFGTDINDNSVYKIENLYNFLVNNNFPYEEGEYGKLTFNINYKGLDLVLECYHNMDGDFENFVNHTYTFYIIANGKEYKNYLKNVPDIINSLKNK